MIEAQNKLKPIANDINEMLAKVAPLKIPDGIFLGKTFLVTKLHFN